MAQTIIIIILSFALGFITGWIWTVLQQVKIDKWKEKQKKYKGR